MESQWCEIRGKFRHATEADARAAAGAVRRRGKHYPGTLSVFSCEHCNGWHFGHDSKKGSTPRHKRRPDSDKRPLPWPKREG